MNSTKLTELLKLDECQCQNTKQRAIVEKNIVMQKQYEPVNINECSDHTDKAVQQLKAEQFDSEISRLARAVWTSDSSDVSHSLTHWQQVAV